MKTVLDAAHFPCTSVEQSTALGVALSHIMIEGGSDPIRLLAGYQRVLADNRRRAEWGGIFEKLDVLFRCGRAASLDGPMIGVSIALRGSDWLAPLHLRHADRGRIAALEWMAVAWNATFVQTGIWMGKTFEPVTRETAEEACAKDLTAMRVYDPATTRIGRNFFREPADSRLLQSLGVPVLTKVWSLNDRPMAPSARGFRGEILAANLQKERAIPYTKTGGLFLSQPGASVLPAMRGKAVYQLTYRWPGLNAVYPMTRLVDELVAIAEGVYLGQLVMATRHYSLGSLHLPLSSLHLPLLGDRDLDLDLGDPYKPDPSRSTEYGYQSNGYFLLVEPALARELFGAEAFPFLRPRPGEVGYVELGYDREASHRKAPAPVPVCMEYPEVSDWARGWAADPALREKFTTFCVEESPCGAADGDVRDLRREGESVLQVLQRIQGEVSAASRFDDRLLHFEQLNRLFRAGVAPRVVGGCFQGQGRGYNTRFDAPEARTWYGQPEPCTGFDYYHGATLNLHLGFADTVEASLKRIHDNAALPAVLGRWMERDRGAVNLMDAVWATIGRFVFPWAGKSFERISPRKLSMLLDENRDLEERYPERVAELRRHPASYPHFDLVRRNREGYWHEPGRYASHLSRSWDQGMVEEDRAFWRGAADSGWIAGANLQDNRVIALGMDPALRVLDMNYGVPLPSIQALADAGPSPFVRQGYAFLGAADQPSNLPMNGTPSAPKRVFQLHYRFPLMGGAAPIGLCLDEIVEIASGLFLGQLIYSTALLEPFHSSVNPARYKYQIFGYFLLLDNVWERHRRAIGFDIDTFE